MPRGSDVGSPAAGEEAANLGKLSPREAEVLACAAEGLVDKEIAVRLGISVHTLHTYWRRIRTKMNSASRAGLVHDWTASRLRETPPGWGPFGRYTLDFEDASMSWFETESDSVGNEHIKLRTLACRVIDPRDFPRWAGDLHHLMCQEKPAFVAEYRVFSRRGLTHVYSLATASYDDAGRPNSIEGFKVETLERIPAPVEGGGYWVSNRKRRLFQASDECCRLFGIGLDQRHDRHAFLEKVEPSLHQGWAEFFGEASTESNGLLGSAVAVSNDGAPAKRLWLQAFQESWPDGQVLVFGQVMPEEGRLSV